MSRPLRFCQPGLWHHVMNRGAARQPLFLCDADRMSFLGLVRDIAVRWRVSTHALCAMDNHYHLLVHDEGGLLSRAIRHLDGVHALRINHAHDRDGPLFRGRFTSRLVQHDRYLMTLVRYIHLNPVMAGIVDDPADYAWSSHAAYAGLVPCPAWLRTDEVIERLGVARGPGSARRVRRALERLVERPLSPRVLHALEPTRWSPIFGSRSFVEGWRRRLRGDDETAPPTAAPPGVQETDVPERQRLTAPGTDEILAAACAAFGRSRRTLLSRRRGTEDLQRRLALLALHERTGATLTELGLLFGMKPRSISALATRARNLVAGGSLEAVQLYEMLNARLVDGATPRASTRARRRRSEPAPETPCGQRSAARLEVVVR